MSLIFWLDMVCVICTSAVGFSPRFASPFKASSEKVSFSVRKVLKRKQDTLTHTRKPPLSTFENL